nr:hypothetical protein [Tanacetum cinerariifolium]
DKIICDINKTPDMSQRPPQNCPKCGNPVDGHYCQGCALLRKKFKEDIFTYCIENGILQDSFKPSNDNTNVVNALQETFIVNQDLSKNSLQSPPQINHNCCYGCGDLLEYIFCNRCTCELCGKGAHYGNNCPPKVLIIPNPGSLNNQTVDELPQTVPSFDPTCYSEDENSFTYDSKSNLVHDSPNVFEPPPQPPFYSCEFCRNDAQSDEFIKSSVENLVPNPSESEDEYDDDQSFSDEDIPKEIYLNPLFDEIDSLFDEFAGKLTLLKSIMSGINETDCDPEEETHFIKRLLYDNSSPCPPEEFISENSDDAFEYFSPSPIPVEDSDSFMEEIDLSFPPDNPMPSRIKEDDYDSERDILLLEELLSNDSLSLPENESFYFDIPLSSRPPAKPPNGNSGILNVKVMGDISEHKVPMPKLMFTQLTLVPNQEKSPKLLPHQGHEAFQPSAECPMMIYGKKIPILDVLFSISIPLDQFNNPRNLKTHTEGFCPPVFISSASLGNHNSLNDSPSISETSSQSPSNINHCCSECGDPLDDIFCKRCTSESPFTLDSTPTYVDESPNVFNPPPQPSLYPCEFCRNDAYYGRYCIPQAPFIYPEQCYNQDFNFLQDFQDILQQYPCCDDCGVTHDAYQCQPMNEVYYYGQNSCYDSTSIGFDQSQPQQYTVDHPIFNAHNSYLDSQIQLNKVDAFLAVEDEFTSSQFPKSYLDPEGDMLLLEIFLNDDHSSDFKTKSSSTSLNSLLEETHNFDNSLPEFITFSNDPCDAEYKSDSNDDQSSSDEDILKKIVSKPLSEEEIIPMESLRTHDSSILISSKIDSLLEEFAGELALLKSIPPGIDETDCDFEKDIFLIEKLLDDNSSSRPLKEFVSANSDAKIKSFSPSRIFVKDSDSIMEEIDLFCTPDYPMPPGIESVHFDIPLFSRPPAKPPDGDTGLLNIKMMGDISDQKAFMHKLMITLAPHQEKSPNFISHRCGTVKKFNTYRSHLNECPMLIPGQNNPPLDVLMFYFYPP